LSVDPSASQDAIKAAYRRLAKEFHPDRNSNPEAAERFRRATIAYEALSDPAARNEYDALRYKIAAERSIPGSSLEPICCERCGKVTAQPHATVFTYAISIIVVSFRNPIQGIFCSACARKTALKASLISALAGWWGFPWGPIFTISSILKNAVGGRSSPTTNESLAWFNSLAFLAKGNYPLSYALARKLRSANTKEIAERSVVLMDYLERRGVSLDTPDLKNPWSVRPQEFLAHLTLLAALPLSLFGAAQIGPSVKLDDPRFSTATIRPHAQLKAAEALPPKQSILPQPQQTLAAPIAKCARSVQNGEVLERNAASREPGHTLEIRNGSGGDAIIKARDAYSRRLQFSFFVKANEWVAYKNIADGTYLIQYAIGIDLRADCKSFIQPKSLGQFPQESLTTSFTSTQIIRHRLSYTLYPVPNGNVRPLALDAGTFDAE
jgi:hypothetical protein